MKRKRSLAAIALRLCLIGFLIFFFWLGWQDVDASAGYRKIGWLIALTGWGLMVSSGLLILIVLACWCGPRNSKRGPGEE